jgi:hypothetical protein
MIYLDVRRQLTTFPVMVGLFYGLIILTMITLALAAVSLWDGLDGQSSVGETGGEVYLAAFLALLGAFFAAAAFAVFRWLRR